MEVVRLCAWRSDADGHFSGTTVHRCSSTTSRSRSGARLHSGHRSSSGCTGHSARIGAGPLPLLARSPRPLLFAASRVATLARSPHAPLSVTPTAQFDGWRVLSCFPTSSLYSASADPEQDGDTNETALMDSPIAQPSIVDCGEGLPGGARAPLEWQRGAAARPVERRIDTEVVLAELEITTWAPLSWMSPWRQQSSDVDRYRKRLEKRLNSVFGPPEDHGSILVVTARPPAYRSRSRLRMTGALSSFGRWMRQTGRWTRHRMLRCGGTSPGAPQRAAAIGERPVEWWP